MKYVTYTDTCGGEGEARGSPFLIFEEKIKIEEKGTTPNINTNNYNYF
jgi:hypothetical protein